jgi:DHA1 family bicyclomycin/chloramphenicol resistance-like MFS transporter
MPQRIANSQTQKIPAHTTLRHHTVYHMDKNGPQTYLWQMNAQAPARFLDRATPPHISTLVLMAGISALSMNIFLPSLPAMTAHFQTEYHLMQLSVALYLGMVAVLQILIGPMADKFGRRPVVIWSSLIFLAATLGCIFASNAYVFLVFRMIQAAISTGLVLSRAIIRDTTDQSNAASKIGYVTMGMAVIPMFSPAIGGLLDQAFGWQANFTMLFVFGALVLGLAWLDLGETGTPSTITLLAQFRQYPDLITSRRFWGYSLIAAFSSGAFFAYLGGAPFVGDSVYGLTSFQLGLYFGITALGYMIGNFLSGRYSVRVGIDRMILVGSLIIVSGLALALIVNLSGAQHPMLFYGFMIFVGLANGLVLPNATSGLLSARPHLIATASGLGGAIMIGGGAALSALAGAVLQPGSGATPLLVIMLVSAVGGLLSYGYVAYINRIDGALAAQGGHG